MSAITPYNTRYALTGRIKVIPQLKDLTQVVDETWYTDVTSQEDDKKVIKSRGHRARFDVTMLTNTAILDPLTKTARSPKLDKKGKIFSMMHVVTHRI